MFCKDAVVAQRCVFPHYLVLLFFHIYRLNDWFLNFSSYFLYSRLALSICWTQSGLLGGKKKGNKPSVHFHLLCIRRKLLPAFINIVHVNFIDKKVSLYYFFTFIVQLYCSLFELRCYSCVNRFGRWILCMCANKADSDSNSDCCWFSLAGKITKQADFWSSKSLIWIMLE